MEPIEKSPPRSRYKVPAAVALAAHAFLFFGFTAPAASRHSTPVRPVSPDPDSCPIELDLAKAEPDLNAADLPAQRQIAAVPMQPEPMPDLIPKAAMVVPVAVQTSGPVETLSRMLPTEPACWGTPDGSSSVCVGGNLGVIDLDNIPRATFQARPDYPFALRREGVSGEVLLNFLVDEKGRVSDVRVARSSNPEFESSAVKAVEKWRFETGKRNGRAVRFRMSQAISFAVGE